MRLAPLSSEIFHILLLVVVGAALLPQVGHVLFAPYFATPSAQELVHRVALAVFVGG